MNLVMVADNQGKHARLNGNFVGMRDEEAASTATKLAATSYYFTIRFERGEQAGTFLRSQR